MTRFVMILLLFAASAVQAAGFQEILAPDPGHAAIQIGIWYPSDAPVSAQPLELWRQTVAPGGPITVGSHGLIVISHGQGGSFGGHYDTALALAAAGYIVVAPTHTGDNWHDQSGVLNIMDRPRQITRVVDYMLSAWPGHASIDPARIGMFGFSAGGFTTLVSIGGVPDMTKTTTYCADHATQYTCKLVASHAGAVIAQIAAVPDPRIKAASIAAPAVAYAFVPDGLRNVSVPVQLWRADADQILPAPDYADAVRAALPTPPQFETVANAGHFDFLAPCSDALAQTVPLICQDAPGFERAAFHQRMNAAIVAFFNRVL